MQPISNVTYPKRKWFLPLLIGMSLPVIAVLVVVLWFRPASGDVYTRAAHGMGVSRADYVQSWNITKHAQNKGEGSDAEWSALQKT